jgi:hypothetical protein
VRRVVVDEPPSTPICFAIASRPKFRYLPRTAPLRSVKEAELCSACRRQKSFLHICCAPSIRQTTSACRKDKQRYASTKQWHTTKVYISFRFFCGSRESRVHTNGGPLSCGCSGGLRWISHPACQSDHALNASMYPTKQFMSIHQAKSISSSQENTSRNTC